MPDLSKSKFALVDFQDTRTENFKNIKIVQ